MLGELERGHRGKGEGGGLDTLVALVPLMASPPWWAGDVRREAAVSSLAEQADGSGLWGCSYSD